MRNLLKQHVGQMLGTGTFPQDQPDLLDPEALLPRAAGHSGFPEATDGLAYEPVQRLLAVSCLADPRSLCDLRTNAEDSQPYMPRCPSTGPMRG